MRLLMMGTGPFAVPTFRSLLQSEHQVLALVTRPIRPPVGRRGQVIQPMREVADAYQVPTLAPQDVNAPETRALLAAWEPELLVVCDFGQILARDTLHLASRGGINLHASLLPEYRGAAPINWALFDGQTRTGVTVIHMTPRMDSGPCLVKIPTPIHPDEDAVALEQRLAELGVQAVHQALERLSNYDGQSPIGEPQDPARATRAPRLKKSDGLVDWNRNARAIRDQVRAFKPWPGTFTYWHRGTERADRLILDKVSCVPGAGLPQACPGEIVAVDSDRVLVATGDQLLSLERVQPAGKRVQEIEAFLRGHPMRTGQRLGPENG